MVAFSPVKTRLFGAALIALGVAATLAGMWEHKRVLIASDLIRAAIVIAVAMLRQNILTPVLKQNYFYFIGVLLLALVYLWADGALDWHKERRR